MVKTAEEMARVLADAAENAPESAGDSELLDEFAERVQEEMVALACRASARGETIPKGARFTTYWFSTIAEGRSFNRATVLEGVASRLTQVGYEAKVDGALTVSYPEKKAEPEAQEEPEVQEELLLPESNGPMEATDDLLGQMLLETSGKDVTNG